MWKNAGDPPQRGGEERGERRGGRKEKGWRRKAVRGKGKERKEGLGEWEGRKGDEWREDVCGGEQ